MWATRLFNNPYLALANRFAPILSASILTCYAIFGKRVEVVRPVEGDKQIVLQFTGLRDHIRRIGGW